MRKFAYCSQSGAALIVALLIIAIIAAIASDFIARSQTDLSRTQLILTAQQAELDTTYSLSWAQSLYMTELAPSQASDLTPSAPLNLPLNMPTFTVKNTVINATLTSAQGYFNLNNLTDLRYIPLFAKLIQTVDKTVGAEQSAAIANDAAYFIGEQLDLKIEKIYEAFIPAYRPSHRLLVSPSELRLVKGVTAELYQKLAPYIIALPQATSVDPVAASEVVFISYGLTADHAQAVIKHTEDKRGFKNINEFYQLANFQPANSEAKNNAFFDLASQYFLLSTTIKVAKIDWTIYSILQKNKTNAKLTLIQQTRNNL